VLKRFKANTVDKYTEDTRMRPDRRKGFDVPGKKHKYRSRILVAIDCSGSMDDKDVERGCAIVNKFVKHADVSYCFWDGVCGPFTEQKQKKNEFKLIGRGCTNPECVLEAIKERKAKFDGIIYFTDMGFDFPRPDHMANKIFMISTPGTESYIPEWVKYHLTTEQLFSIEE
jgi:predicted metal-dependent peptidase